MEPKTENSSSSRRLLYCHCAYSRVVPKDVKAEVLRGLAASDRAFDAVPDLCELAARCDPGLKKLAQPENGGVDIVACYPRAVRWLFHAAEAPLADDGVDIHNMRVDSAQRILHTLGLAEAPDDPTPDADPSADAPTSTPTQPEEAKP